MRNHTLCLTCKHPHPFETTNNLTVVAEQCDACACSAFRFSTGGSADGFSWKVDHSSEEGAAAAVEHKKLCDERATLKAELVRLNRVSAETIVDLQRAVRGLREQVRTARTITQPLLTIALAGNRASAHPAMLKGLQEISEALSVE